MIGCWGVMHVVSCVQSIFCIISIIVCDDCTVLVEKGIFKKGDNALVDSLVFKEKNVKVKKLKDYPIDAIYGKKLKAPKEMSDVRSLVTSDYQELLERNWVAELRKKYLVEVYEEVVKTVNNH